MLQLWFLGIGRYLRLLGFALVAPFERGRSFFGGLLVLLAFPLLLVWQSLHWLGLLLDEVLFRGYRKIEVRQPLFVIGPPRTGTTFLHHALSNDRSFTTFTTWECLFGLSITGRFLCRGLARIDRSMGSPVRKLAELIARPFTRSMSSIHPLELDAPEEDFLCLMPFAACFLLVVPFPRAGWLWDFARFDSQLSARQREIVMRWYRRCIQKHLYVAGTDKRFLSKNASFCGLAGSLLEEFPDARILVTWRDPVKTVPSQLSSLRPGLAACGFKSVSPAFRDRLTDLLLHDYVHIDAIRDDNKDRVTTIDNQSLRDAPAEAIACACKTLGVDISDDIAVALSDVQSGSRSASTTHHYSLDEFDLDADEVMTQFAAVYRRAESRPG